ncbi:MAG: FadR family transcriptional regulator [Methanomassiliicoccales archaeon]|nr:FadR family transcriptional regulator [Methanomassiliicoccales archaeon]
MNLKELRVAQELLKDIAIFKKYQPGDKLPSERDLAKMFGVSRTVVREALIALRYLGVIERYISSGSYVKEIGPYKSLQRKLDNLLGLGKDPLEAWQAREVLEPGIARLAAREATFMDIQQLRKAVGEMEAAVIAGAISNFYSTDRDLHYAILQATHNEYLLRLISPLINCVVHPIWWEIKSESINGADEPFRLSLSLHMRIVQAIEAHDEDAAYAQMQMHFSVLGQYLIDKKEVEKWQRIK